MSFSKCLIGAVLSCLCHLPLAQGLPTEVLAALTRAKVPPDAVSVLLADTEGKASPRLNHRATTPVNPASVMKLVTTFAALELLGPAFSWRTPVLVEGAVRDGTLYGNLYIVGQGDPKLVSERLWLLLRRVQALGIHTIAGDIVLDRSAFDTSEPDPAGFDGEPLKPYNAAPDALLINFKSVLMTFVPERSSNSARVQFEPPLGDVQLQTSVPLVGGDCGDYRSTLKADFAQASQIRFGGSYPASCGEQVWPVAYTEPKSFGTRAVAGMWQEIGGKLSGKVREGRVPMLPTAPPQWALEPVFEINSPPLAELIRDINKFSNNVMAQQLFLTLSLPVREPGSRLPGQSASLEASREVVRNWWKNRFSGDDMPLLDNGSGLSRRERISAQALGKLLQSAYKSPLMPELMASLPITGVDGTLRRRPVGPRGSAHLKTGSLRDVTALAGYVDGASGKRMVLVAVVNHPNAFAARPAMAALIEWAAKEN